MRAAQLFVDSKIGKGGSLNNWNLYVNFLNNQGHDAPPYIQEKMIFSSRLLFFFFSVAIWNDVFRGKKFEIFNHVRISASGTALLVADSTGLPVAYRK